MEPTIAFLYGVIQGATEFLPVSSSGHLALLPFFMTFQDPGVAFDLSLHVGTAFAVIIYFRSKLKNIIKSSVTLLLNKMRPQTSDEQFAFNFILATICSVALIVVLKPLSESARSPLWIAFNMAFFGLLLGFAGQKKSLSQHVTKKDALLIGLSQALAIFPGVSRSGITLTMALWRGIAREQAGAFSFLLSLPIILAGAIVKARDLSQIDINMNTLFIGVLTSLIVGVITIHYFLKILSRLELWWFTAYRLLLSLIIISLIYVL